MAAKKSPKKTPSRKSRTGVDARPAETRIETLEATLEELSVVIRALMRDSATAARFMKGAEGRLHALERKAGPRKR